MNSTPAHTGVLLPSHQLLVSFTNKSAPAHDTAHKETLLTLIWRGTGSFLSPVSFSTHFIEIFMCLYLGLVCSWMCVVRPSLIAIAALVWICGHFSCCVFLYLLIPQCLSEDVLHLQYFVSVPCLRRNLLSSCCTVTVIKNVLKSWSSTSHHPFFFPPQFSYALTLKYAS